MRGHEKEKLNNAGFSLVELIVAVVLTAAISLMVVVFISMSRTTYSVIDTSTVLQTESQSAAAIVQRVAEVSSEFGDRSSIIGATVMTSTLYDTAVVTDFCWFKGIDIDSALSDDEYYYFFVLKSDNTLHFVRIKSTVWDADPTAAADNLITTAVGTNAPYSLLAEYVEGISVSRSSDKSKKGTLINITINYKYRDETSVTNLSLLARNMQN